MRYVTNKNLVVIDLSKNVNGTKKSPKSHGAYERPLTVGGPCYTKSAIKISDFTLKHRKRPKRIKIHLKNQKKEISKNGPKNSPVFL